jgi:hypothetical protein
MDRTDADRRVDEPFRRRKSEAKSAQGFGKRRPIGETLFVSTRTKCLPPVVSQDHCTGEER